VSRKVESRVRRFAPRLDSNVQFRGGQAPAIFWSADAELCITSAQGTGLALLNLQPEELIGARLGDAFRRQDPDLRFLSAHQRALEGEASRFEATWAGRAFDVQIEPLRGADDEVVGVIGAALETTGRKREESAAGAGERRFRALIENSLDMIALVGPEGTILYASPSTTRIFGYPLEEFVGRNAFELIHPEDLERTHRLLAELLEKPGGSVVAECRLRAQDGSWRWIEGSGTNLLQEPNLQAVVVNYRDISGRKRAEQRLGTSEDRLRTIIQAEPQCVKIVAPDGTLLDMNAAGLAMIEADRADQVIGKSVYTVISDAHREEFRSLTEAVCRGSQGKLEYEVVGLKGTRRWLETHAVPLRGERDEIVGALSVTRDITDRRRAEAERQVIFEIIHGTSVTANLDELLRLIHQALRKVLYAENCFVALFNRSTRMFHFPFFVDQFDAAPPPQKVGRSCTAFVFRAGRPMLITQKLFDELAAQGEVELVGTPSPNWLGVPLRTPSETIGVLVVQHYEDENAYTGRDLEFLASVGGQIALAIERKQAEDALRKQQQEQQIIFNSAPYMIWYKDKENRILRANRAAAESAGLAVSEIEGKSTSELYPEEAERYHQDDLEAIRTGQPKLGIIEPFRIASGEKRWVRTDKIPYRDDEGNIIGLIVFATDITEQQRAEEALRRSEANNRSLIQNAPYGIYRSNADGKLLDVNPALVEMLGYNSEAELLAANMARDIYCDLAERARTLEHDSGHLQGVEVVWRRKDGTPITVRLSGRSVRDASGEIHYERIAENVTEQRALEHQLRQAQKMEAVGRLAGGVAHDFNNLLMVIKGHTELLLDRGSADEWQLHKIEQIKKSADRAAALIRQLLAFSRMQVLQPKVIDLNTVVIEMGKLLPRLIGEDVELAIVTDPRLGRVKADPGQIEQVIMNLAVNARDAMPRGGKLLIETLNAELDEAYARRHPPLGPGRYVMLAVSDTGIGMDAETQAHAFEPFFTTKEKGKGTGLGLATVYGVVKQSGGYIWLYSEPGQGSSFKIYLPRVEEAAEAARSGRTSVEFPPGTETILLAEDERDVREVAREFLALSGYTVLEAKDGAEAVEIARQHAGPIHLLVADMVMPGMGGRELAARLAPLRPEMKVVYMSGYTEYARTSQDETDRKVALLTKPFTRGTLARTVREVLQGGKFH
jgi:PAS domain S-box-containing protein